MKGNDLLWSRYNFIVQSHGNEHLYNSYSNCLLKLDRHLANSLNALQNGEPLPDNIIKDFSCEEIEYFKKNKILVENDDDLVEILHTHSMARLFSNKSFVLTIAPTHSCNFDCSYCYEQFRMSTPMTDKTANAIVDYIDNLKQNNGLEVLYITWYGGEPLMQLHRVCSLSKKLNSLGLLVKENNIITNGYFLTEANTRELVDAGINEMQITLDGNRITHDSRRHLKNGNGSYDVIIQNLDSFFSNHHDKEICLSIRVNIDKTNYEDYISTYRQLRDRYANHNFIIYPGIIFLDEKNACSHSCMSRNEVTDMFLSLYKKHGIISERLYPDAINIACKARSPYGNMLIGSRGEIYKCFEDLGDEKRIVGNINDKVKWNNFKLISRYATGIDHYLDSECKVCPYLPICNGGCPIRRYENVYCDRHNDCCTPFKGRISDYIDLFLEGKEH